MGSFQEEVAKKKTKAKTGRFSESIFPSRKKKKEQSKKEEDKSLSSIIDDYPDAEDWEDDLDNFLEADIVETLKLKSIAMAQHQATILRCRADCNAFIEYAFTDADTGEPIRQAWFHRELQAAFEKPEHRFGLYVLPRDHGKTTQVEAYCLWRLGNNPNLRIKIVCASDDKAKERLFTLIQHLEHNPMVTEVFPWLKPADVGDWTKHKIVVSRDYIMRDASVEALGVMSTATGGRADLLIGDDVVDRRNALEQPKLRETIKVAWDADWVNLLEPSGQVIYICTLWHTADLTHRLLQNAEYAIMRYDVAEDLSPLWPEKWPREALEARRRAIGPREFDRGFRNIALSGEVAHVKPEWIHYWKVPPNLSNLIIFQAHDPSTGKGSDYFGTVTIGVDLGSEIGGGGPANEVKSDSLPATENKGYRALSSETESQRSRALRIYVLTAFHGLYTHLAQVEIIKTSALEWRPFKIGVEYTSFSGLVQYLEETTLLDIVPLKPRLSKSLRLQAITPYLERGMVLFNPALNPASIPNPLELGDLVTELLQFPLGAHDDVLDAFVHAFNLARDYVLEESALVTGEGVRVEVISSEGSEFESSRERNTAIEASTKREARRAANELDPSGITSAVMGSVYGRRRREDVPTNVEDTIDDLAELRDYVTNNLPDDTTEDVMYKTMSIYQGYVPRECTLAGSLVWALVNDHRVPCAGCREKCDSSR